MNYAGNDRRQLWSQDHGKCDAEHQKCDRGFSASRTIRAQCTSEMKSITDDETGDLGPDQNGAPLVEVNDAQSSCLGARPKQKIEKYQASEEVLEGEKQLQIEIKVGFHIKTGTELKETYTFECDLREYMIWMYMMNSPVQCKKCSRHCSTEREKICLRTDSSFTILSPANNKEHVFKIAQKVWSYAISELGVVLTAEPVEIKGNDIGKGADQLNETFREEIAYAAAINDCIYVVFPSSKKEIVKMLLQEAINDEEKGIFEDTVILKKVFIKFQKVIEAFSGNKINLQIIIKENNTVVCSLKGPEKDVIDAVKKLKSMENCLKMKDINFSTRMNRGLQELFVEDMVNKQLENVFPHCVLEQTGNCICLYSFNETELLKASRFVEDLIVEWDQKLENCPQTVDIFEHIQNKFKEELLVGLDRKTFQLYMMGLKKTVEMARIELEDLQQGHSQLLLEITDFYPVRHKLHFRYFKNSVFCNKVAAEFNVEISFCQNDFSIKVKGFEENVKRALQTICKIEKAICSEVKVFPQSKSDHDFAIKSSDIFLKQTEKEHNVLIEKQDIQIFGHTENQVLKETHDSYVIWSAPKGRYIYLESLSMEKAIACVKIKPGAAQPLRGNIIKGEYIVKMGIPVWKDGTHHETDELAEILGQVFNEASRLKNQKTIAFSLTPVENWRFDEYMKSVVNYSVEWLLTSQIDTSFTVKLCVEDQQCFSRTDTYVDHCVASIAVSQLNRQIETIVCKGQLDKVEADVLVNTAAPNLDLAKGYVSAALTRRAGPKLQKECKKQYPKGITHGEVAETRGYDADCKQIFHVTLQPYSDEDAAGRKESFRSVMMLCLKKAASYEHKSIAFPAMGTGSLGYPAEVVASEMFGTVERFKDECPHTSLERVIFVIYYKDVELLQYFEKIKRETSQNPVIPSSKQRGRPAVKFTITGTKENVDSAKTHIKEEIEKQSESVTRRITDVSSTVCAAVQELFNLQMESLRDNGVNIEYVESRHELLLTGTVDPLQVAYKTVSEYVTKVKKMHRRDMSVPEIGNTSVEEVIREVRYSRSDVCSIYDKNVGKIITFAYSMTQLDDVQEEIQRNLKDKDDDVLSLKDSQRFEEEMEISDTEDNGYGVSAESVRPIVQRTFSWSKVSKNLHVYQLRDIILKVYVANITEVPVDGIVNAANENLQHCGGVAQAIAKAAGVALIDECETLTQKNKGPFGVASVVCTCAGNLDYKCVLHAVGPRWSDYQPISRSSLKKCEKDLKRTVMKCFELAEEKNLTSVALPTVSSGIFKVPKDVCAIQYAKAVLEFKGNRTLKEIHFVDIEHGMVDIIHKTFTEMITKKGKPPYDVKLYYDNSKAPITSRQSFYDFGRNDSDNAVNEFDHQSAGGRFQNRHTSIDASFILDGNKLKCHFETNLLAEIYVDDIVNLSGIQAIVCSEDRTGQAKGMVARLLLQQGGEDYRQMKSLQFRYWRNDWEVIITPAGKNSFEWVIHAVVPRKDTGTIALAYCNIFKAAKERNLTSLALPLLGTGIGGLDEERSAEELFNELLQFYQCNRRSSLIVHIVLKDRTVASVVQDLFKRRIHEMKLPSRKTEEMRKLHADVKTDTTSVEIENIAKDGDNPPTLEDCVICMDKVTDGVKLKCGHIFCRECIDGYFKVKKVCPTCGQVCGIITGDQPNGTMEITKRNIRLSGFDRHVSISITYNFSGGSQGPDHPRPGSAYKGITRTAYLPDNKEGREVCAMLKVAFERRLVFTIGTSRTTGEEGVITWNDIHHKTDPRPNTQFGYPDKTYLQRVREEMEVKGISLEDMDKKFQKQLEENSFRLKFHVNA